MYHNTQNYTVEIPDGIAEITRAVVIEKEDGTQILTLEAVLREDQKFNPDAGTPRLHLTNGVNHHYIDLSYSKVEAAPIIEELSEEPVKKGKK
jgi:hypothetical protein